MPAFLDFSSRRRHAFIRPIVSATSITSSAWPRTLTSPQTAATLPWKSIRKVERRKNSIVHPELPHHPELSAGFPVGVGEQGIGQVEAPRPAPGALRRVSRDSRHRETMLQVSVVMNAKLALLADSEGGAVPNIEEQHQRPASHALPEPE